MTNLELSLRFDEVADLLELQEANPFRVRAYRNAARTISQMTEPVADLADSDPGQLLELPGVGKDIAAKMTLLIESGTFPLLEELRSQFPKSLIEVTRLPGLGAKKAATLHRELQIQSLDDLKAAAEAGRIAALKGFGKKSEQGILAALAQQAQVGKRFLISEARLPAEAVLDDLKQLPGVKQSALAGSARRWRETCGDLDLLVTADDSQPVMQALAEHSLVESVLSRGETKQRVRLHTGIELDLRVVPDESFGAALLYFTGSKDHNIVLRKRAQARDLKLNEYGLFRGDELVAGRTEEDVYEQLGLHWIPPELREARREFEWSEQNALPKLLELSDIRGDLHMHTTASDGKATIREMIEAARARGLKYIAITDHSKRVSMANGLDATRLRKHWDDIRKIREDYSDIDVLLGIECDILENAELDLPDDVLAEADWTLAVLHYGLKQPGEQIMKRLLAAIRNPHICAIGHPTGRMLSRRAGAEIDFSVFLKAAAEHGVMLEINANPRRLDLDDVHAAAARELGIPIVINTDSHSTDGFELMHYGVYQARRAGLTKQDVANTRTAKQFRKLLRTHKS